MERIEKIAQDLRVQNALAAFGQRVDQAVQLITAVQQIPAPTFAEGWRADFIQRCFSEVGLQSVRQDALHNVYGCYPATMPISERPVIISAHNDTVFSAETDLTVQRNGAFIYGPGIGDNATGVAGLLLLAQALQEFTLPLPADVWFVANVGEEGLGDLRGMRAVVNHFGRQATYVIVEGGLYGQISHQAIGVRRFRIEVKAPGGHSWGSFGNASAVHELGHMIVAIATLPVPEAPKTTYNVGVIEGGTSVNTIAQSATLLLDLRSEDPAALADLEQAVEKIVARANSGRGEEGYSGVTAAMSLIGNRPAGHIPRHAPLVTWAEAALRQVGCQQVSFIASSTDANIPLSQGIPAVCIGLTESGNAHRLDEYMDPTYLPNGLGQLLLLTLAAAGF
jgi:acetylornithine deacetylase/succinyl-diaminopimelate desuccinylase-like protein